MITIAVTGGVACGKTSACAGLVDRIGVKRADHFSCDEAVGGLLERKEIQEGIRSLDGGAALFRPEFEKGELRKLVFDNPEFRGKLEGLLHPEVLSLAKDFCQTRSSHARILLIEVPLLYEVEFPIDRDMDLVVGSSPEVQIGRLVEGRGIEKEFAEKMIGSQLPIETKTDRGDVVIWNDGTRKVFESQLDQLANRCSPLFHT